MNSSQIIGKIGVDVLAAALGVSAGAVREQWRAQDGLMPSSWFTVVRDLAGGEGVSVTEAMFRFRLPPPVVASAA
jgi:hypothetical protein